MLNSFGSLLGLIALPTGSPLPALVEVADPHDIDIGKEMVAFLGFALFES